MERLDANRRHWDEITPRHAASDFYDLAGFRAGRDPLRAVERRELGHRVAGRRLLHLQCHFGMDTLAWARRGAVVTGADISGASIALARQLSEELGIAATFVESSVEELPARLDGTFDIVFTSYGVVHWLEDLDRWAAVIAHFLAPGGLFYMVEMHPMLGVLDEDDLERRPAYPYFRPGPIRIVEHGSYAAAAAAEEAPSVVWIWRHTLGEIVSALAAAGLRIDYLHEFAELPRARLAGMVPTEDGMYRIEDRPGLLPLLYSIEAHRPG
jgi:SAM-dependent methyltransferase